MDKESAIGATRKEFLKAGALIGVAVLLGKYDDASAAIEQIDSDALVMSEVLLPHGIPERLSERVHYYHQFMSSLKPHVLITAHAPSEYKPEKQLALVNRKDVLPSDPTFWLDHELHHAMFFDFKNQRGNVKATRTFNKLYDKRVTQIVDKNINYAMECEPLYDPSFKLFDESEYSGVRCTLGHPADTADELFASGLNCMIHFEDKMLDKLEKLNSEVKEWAIKVIESITYITDKQSSAGHVSQLFIPANSKLRQTRTL